MQITSKIVKAGPYATVTQPPQMKELGYQVLMIVNVVLPGIVGLEFRNFCTLYPVDITILQTTVFTRV